MDAPYVTRRMCLMRLENLTSACFMPEKETGRQKLTVAQLSQNYPPLMETEGLLPRSLVLSFTSCSREIHFNIILQPACWYP
jgi:hypothetical protein